MASVGAGRLELGITYSANLYREETIERVADGCLDELRRLLAETVGASPSGDTPASRVWRLSPVQQGLLFRCLEDPGAGLYFTQAVYELEGEVIAGALRRALERLIERHDVLRTAFDWRAGGEPWQVVHEAVPLPWQELDWRGVAATQRAAAVGEFSGARLVSRLRPRLVRPCCASAWCASPAAAAA